MQALLYLFYSVFRYLWMMMQWHGWAIEGRMGVHRYACTILSGAMNFR